MIPTSSLPSLSYVFWPKTNHGTGYRTDFGEPTTGAGGSRAPLNQAMIEFQNEEQQEMEECAEIFVGHRSEKERERWYPLNGIQDGQFVILRPSDDCEKNLEKVHFGW